MEKIPMMKEQEWLLMIHQLSRLTFKTAVRIRLLISWLKDAPHSQGNHMTRVQRIPTKVSTKKMITNRLKRTFFKTLPNSILLEASLR